MLKWLTPVVFLVFAAVAHSTPNLAVVCTVASEVGKPVAASCGNGGTSSQIYATPKTGTLVRVDAAKKPGDGASWSEANTAYKWALWETVAPGAVYEVCLTDVPENTPVTALCNAWAFAAKSSPIILKNRVVNLTWEAPTQNTDNTPLSLPVTYKIYRCKDGTGSGCGVLGTYSSLSAALANQPLGIWCYGITANTKDGESAMAGPVCALSRLVAPTGKLEQK